MVEKNKDPLEFDAVVRQFAAATEALTKVKEQLRDLASLREAEEKVHSTLQETADQVAKFSAGAATTLEGLEDAQAAELEVLAARGYDEVVDELLHPERMSRQAPMSQSSPLPREGSEILDSRL